MQAALPTKQYWDQIIAPYTESSNIKSLWQLFETLIIFSGVCYAMYLTVESYYILTLLLSLIGGLLVVKLFVLQHDCGHGSFFKNERANKIIGRMLSVLTLTPFAQWTKEHKRHHATCGNLDNRGIGDVYTFTVKEYANFSPLGKICYRIYRHPLFLFTLGSFYYFVIKQRLVCYRANRLSSWISVMATNLFILLFISSLAKLIGTVTFLKIYIPIIFVAASIGTWVFYVQHQYEDVYWESNETGWNYYDAALKGSSFYDIPKFLHWFTGNIGYHHIHHLSSKVPNYNLPKCYSENPILQNPTKLTLWESRKCLSLALWDEEHKKLVAF